MDTNQESFVNQKVTRQMPRKHFPIQGLEQGSITIIDARPGKLPKESIKESKGPWGAEFPQGLSLALCCGLAVQGEGRGLQSVMEAVRRWIGARLCRLRQKPTKAAAGLSILGLPELSQKSRQSFSRAWMS